MNKTTSTSSCKLGMVLAGGGAKGAYQIGVWRALAEAGIADKISVVSGTSVGALNTVLFAQGDIALAEKIWSGQLQKSVMSLDMNGIIRHTGDVVRVATQVKNPVATIIYAADKIISKGMFGTGGLSSLISEYVSAEKLRQSKIAAYATCTKLEGGLVPTVKRFKLNGQSPQNIKDILLSSCSLPAVFGEKKMRQDTYYDGGITDNVPVAPLAGEGCAHAIVVCLNKSSRVHTPSGSNMKLHVLYPSEELGTAGFSTVDFSPSEIARRMQLGYRDGCKFVGKLSVFTVYPIGYSLVTTNMTNI